MVASIVHNVKPCGLEHIKNVTHNKWHRRYPPKPQHKQIIPSLIQL